MTPEIRQYRPDDVMALERLVAEMQDYERGIDGRLLKGSEMAEEYTRTMQARCASRRGAILMVELDGDVVGFAAVQAEVPCEASHSQKATTGSEPMPRLTLEAGQTASRSLSMPSRSCSRS